MTERQCMMVGYDAAALEQRVAAWYTWRYDQGWYAEEILDGDYHTKMAAVYQQYQPKVTRSSGKNITYGGHLGD